MNEGTRDALLEGATSAWRDRDVEGKVVPSPDWWDLSPADREVLFERQMESRRLERSISADGLSSTTRAVLERL